MSPSRLYYPKNKKKHPTASHFTTQLNKIKWLSPLYSDYIQTQIQTIKFSLEFYMSNNSPTFPTLICTGVDVKVLDEP